MKKLMGLMVITIALSSMFCTTAAAMGGPNGGAMQPNEIVLTNEEQIQIIEKNPDLSPEMKKQLIDKYNVKNTRNVYYANDLNMTQFKQKYDYYCGPASVYQTLYYLNGSSPSQDTIAKGLGTTDNGTDGTRIPPYINGQQSKNTYVTYQISDMLGLKGGINYGMIHDFPVIIRVKLLENSGFGYTSSGHFLNVGGQTQGADEYIMVDPFFGYKGGPTAPKYKVSADNTFNAVYKHFAKHIYY